MDFIADRLKMEVFKMNEETKVTETTETKVEATPDVAAAKEETTPEKTFTQAEVDELIQKRIARELKKFDKKLAEAAKPTEEQVNLEDENKKLKDLLSSQNKQILNYEATKIAGTLNVKADRLEAFLRLADLSGVELDDKGTYKDEIKEALESVAKDYPEFLNVVEKKETGAIKVGAAPSQLSAEDILRQQIEKGMGL